MLRNTASILLIFVLVFHFSGGQLLFQIRRQLVRQEIKTQIKQGVPKADLVEFKFARGGEKLKKLQWHNDHEFRYNGSMYDIVEKSETADSLIFKCVNDHQETLLFANLEKLLQKKWSHGPAQEQQHLVSSVLSGFYLPAKEIHFDQSTANNKSNSYSPYCFHAKTWIQAPDTPPPKG